MKHENHGFLHFRLLRHDSPSWSDASNENQQLLALNPSHHGKNKSDSEGQTGEFHFKPALGFPPKFDPPLYRSSSVGSAPTGIKMSRRPTTPCGKLGEGERQQGRGTQLRLHRSSSVPLLPTRWGENHSGTVGSPKSLDIATSVSLKGLPVGTPFMSPRQSPSRKTSVPPIRPQRHLSPMTTPKPEVLLEDVVWESLE